MGCNLWSVNEGGVNCGLGEGGNEEEVKVLVCVRIVFLASWARFAVEELLTLST